MDKPLTDAELLEKLWRHATSDLEAGARLKYEMNRYSHDETAEHRHLRDDLFRVQGRTDFARLMVATMKDGERFKDKAPIDFQTGSPYYVDGGLIAPDFPS